MLALLLLAHEARSQQAYREPPFEARKGGYPVGGRAHLLGFQLLPRLKNIDRRRLSRPAAGQPDTYARLQHVLSRPIDRELIRQQYDEMVKYATALRLGTAETETILRRFTRSNVGRN